MRISYVTKQLDEFFLANPGRGSLKTLYYLNERLKKAKLDEVGILLQQVFEASGEVAGGKYNQQQILYEVYNILRDGREEVKKQIEAQRKAEKFIDYYLTLDKDYQEYQTLVRQGHIPGLQSKFMKLALLKTTLATSLLEAYDFSTFEKEELDPDFVADLKNTLSFSGESKEKTKENLAQDLKEISIKYHFNPEKSSPEEIAKIFYDNRHKDDITIFVEQNKQYLVSLALENIDAAKQILKSTSLTKNFSGDDVIQLIDKYRKDIQKSAYEVTKNKPYDFNNEINETINQIKIFLVADRNIKNFENAVSSPKAIKTFEGDTMFTEVLKVLSAKKEQAQPQAKQKTKREEPEYKQKGPAEKEKEWRQYKEQQKAEQPKPQTQFKDLSKEQKEKAPKNLQETLHPDEIQARFEAGLKQQANRFVNDNVDIYKKLGLEWGENNQQAIAQGYRKKIKEQGPSKELNDIFNFMKQPKASDFYLEAHDRAHPSPRK